MALDNVDDGVQEEEEVDINEEVEGYKRQVKKFIEKNFNISS